MTEKTPSLCLTEARALLRRAIDKAEDLSQAGTYVLVDGGGNIVTASRMDGAGQLSFYVSRAKAYAAAIHRIETGMLNTLYTTGSPILFLAMNQLAPKDLFPGPGARLVRDGDGRVIGAFSTGMGVVPAVRFPNVDPDKLIADGKAANAEDLCSAYAQRQPYVGQHTSDEEAWLQAYGKPPEGRGRGLDESPKASKQFQLDAAIRLADAAMAEAARRNVLICAAIVDRNSDVIQVDRMDGAPPMTPDIAISLAITAVNFGTSAKAADYPSLDALASATTFKFLPVPGGVAITDGGRTVGAIGIGGADPATCEAIARTVVGEK